MRLYALVEAGDPEAIDVYLCGEDAQRALEDCLRDEPEWRGVLRSRRPSSQARARRRTSFACHAGIPACRGKPQAAVQNGAVH
jgi:hypothetical protein